MGRKGGWIMRVDREQGRVDGEEGGDWGGREGGRWEFEGGRRGGGNLKALFKRGKWTSG